MEREKRQLDSGLADKTGTSVRLQSSLLLFLDQAVSALFRECQDTEGRVSGHVQVVGVFAGTIVQG